MDIILELDLTNIVSTNEILRIAGINSSNFEVIPNTRFAKLSIQHDLYGTVDYVVDSNRYKRANFVYIKVKQYVVLIGDGYLLVFSLADSSEPVDIHILMDYTVIYTTLYKYGYNPISVGDRLVLSELLSTSRVKSARNSIDVN